MIQYIWIGVLYHMHSIFNSHRVGSTVGIFLISKTTTGQSYGIRGYSCTHSRNRLAHNILNFLFIRRIEKHVAFIKTPLLCHSKIVYNIMIRMLPRS